MKILTCSLDKLMGRVEVVTLHILTVWQGKKYSNTE